jgi:hypothetical protein
MSSDQGIVSYELIEVLNLPFVIQHHPLWG